MTMHPADREILDHFRRTRDKTIELVERIPEDLLDRTPPAESGPLLKLLAHAGCAEAWRMANSLTGSDARVLFIEKARRLISGQ